MTTDTEPATPNNLMLFILRFFMACVYRVDKLWRTPAFKNKSTAPNYI